MRSINIPLLLCICIALMHAIPPTAKPSRFQRVNATGAHFTSAKAKTKTYILNNIEQSKPLAIVYVPKDVANNPDIDVAMENPLSVVISDDKGQSVSCKLSRFNSFCLLDEIKNKDNTSVKTTCQKLPCQFTFKALQVPKAPEIQLSKGNLPNQLYVLSGKEQIILNVRSNDTALKQLYNQVQVYSDAEYDSIDEGPLAYYEFKSKVDKVIVVVSPKIFMSSMVSFFQNPSQLKFNEQSKILVTSTKQLAIKKIPTKQIRLDAAFIDAFSRQMIQANVTFIGIKDGKRTEIADFILLPYKNSSSRDVSFVLVAEQVKDFTELVINITSKQQVFVIANLTDDDVHQLSIGEDSYFKVKAGEQLQFKILPDENRGTDDKKAILIRLASTGEATLKQSQTPCYNDKGCTVTIDVKNDTNAMVHVSLETVTKDDVEYITIKTSETLVLKQGETDYLIYNQTWEKGKEIYVSSSNVMVYAAGDKCKKPSSKCNQFVGNSDKLLTIEHHTGPLYIGVEALDTTRVQIKIVDADQDLQLDNGIPVYINMGKDHDIFLKFHIKNKTDVSFNLMAPLNAFHMYVSNSDDEPDDNDMDLTDTSSYNLKFDKDEIDQLVFTIKIVAAADKPDQSFSLIATTQHSVVTLEHGIPHYDLLQSKQKRFFGVLIQQDDIVDKNQNLLNIDVYQKTIQTNLSVMMFAKGVKNGTLLKVVTDHSDSIGLNSQITKICEDQEDPDFCEVYISVSNDGTEDVDVTFALVNQNTMIQLQSGIWQKYQMSTVTSRIHFYFYPTNKKYPTFVQFSHNLASYKMSHRLWNNQGLENDSGKWPFPSTIAGGVLTASSQHYEAVYTGQDVEKCFPNCIVLISLQSLQPPKPLNNDPNVVQPTFAEFGYFSIMASDRITELTEDVKVTVSLGKKESRYFLVDVSKYIGGNQTLTFFTADLIGHFQIFGSISDPRKPRQPTPEEYDFLFTLGDYQITPSQLNDKATQAGIRDPHELDLIIMAYSKSPSKFLFDFTSKDEFIQPLAFGVPQTVHLNKGDSSLYTVQYYLNYRVKLMRRSGFPYLTYQVCKKSDIEGCIIQLQKVKEAQINSKNQQIFEKQCVDCLLFIKLSAKEQPCEVVLTAISAFSTVTLSEGVVVSDFGVVNQTLSYSISGLKQKNIVISITVFQGQPQVRVLNRAYNVNITGKRIGNLFHIMIPSNSLKRDPNYKINISAPNASNTTNTSDPNNTANTTLAKYLSNFVNSQTNFISFEIDVVDRKQNTSFQISYTLGQRFTDLVDGMLMSGLIKSNQTVTYNYNNFQNQTAIVSLTFNDSDMLEETEIVIRAYNIGDSTPQQTKPQKVDIKKKTPKPTLTFPLDQQIPFFEIVLHNKKSKDILFNLTINHVDLVLLPFGYEYPSTLGKNESQYFIIEAGNQGYIHFNVRKCSDTDLNFAYALDDESFQKQQYSYEAAVDTGAFSSFVHVKSSTLFVKLYSEEGALFSIKADTYKNKKDVPKDNTFKAGRKGVVDFTINANNEAEIYFSPVVCQGKCPNFTYYYLQHKEYDQVLSQVSCPGSFFLLQEKAHAIAPNTIKPIKATNDSTLNKFNIKLPSELTYIGIKAVSGDGREVAYNVVEVATMWGTFQKQKKYHFALLMTGVGCILICVALRIRRYWKSGYDPVPYRTVNGDF